MLKIDRRVYLNMLACFFITLFATKVKNKGIIVLSVRQISTPEKVSKLYFPVVKNSKNSNR